MRAELTTSASKTFLMLKVTLLPVSCLKKSFCLKKGCSVNFIRMSNMVEGPPFASQQMIVIEVKIPLTHLKYC